jgi:hypothetical protein
VVVDGGVDVVIADSPAAMAGGVAVLVRVTAVHPVAAPWAEPSQLLDIHVDQLTGVGALIAADHLAGGPVHGGQPVHSVAAQHPVDG